MAWKGESRRHSLARKGVKTAKGEIRCFINAPTGEESGKLTKEDVWGRFDENYKMIDNGMVVARGLPSGYESESDLPTICPIWNEKLPYKSVTVVTDQALVDDVIYWLEYVHGGGSVSKMKKINGDKVAIRSNYMCW